MNKPAGHAPGETRGQTMHRMLIKARDENLQVYPMAHLQDVYVAISTGKRGAYTVRPGVPQAGCNCDGYRRHHYCKHYALACHMHGFQVEIKAATVRCPDCRVEVEALTDQGICADCHGQYLDLAYEEHREWNWPEDSNELEAVQ